jgi:hypothetical protein
VTIDPRIRIEMGTRITSAVLNVVIRLGFDLGIESVPQRF